MQRSMVLKIVESVQTELDSCAVEMFSIIIFVLKKINQIWKT